MTRRQAHRLHGAYAANEATDLQSPPEAEAEAASRFEGLLRCRLDVTEHQRQMLVDLHRRAVFSEDAIRQVELELDRFEIALDTQLATVKPLEADEAAPVIEISGATSAPDGKVAEQ